LVEGPEPSTDVTGVEEHGDDVGVEATVVRVEGVGLVQRLALLVGSVEAELDLSIFRAESKRILLFWAEKILPMTIPLDSSSLNFRVEPGFGRAARVFYSVK
jgi:hypothetical protein